MRIRKLVAVLLVILLLPAIPTQAKAETEYQTPEDLPETPEGYNDNDYQKLVTFLETTDSTGKTNGAKLSKAYNPKDPTTWGEVIDEVSYGIVWTEKTVEDEDNPGGGGCVCDDCMNKEYCGMMPGGCTNCDGVENCGCPMCGEEEESCGYCGPACDCEDCYVSCPGDCSGCKGYCGEDEEEDIPGGGGCMCEDCLGISLGFGCSCDNNCQDSDCGDCQGCMMGGFGGFDFMGASQSNGCSSCGGDTASTGHEMMSSSVCGCNYDAPYPGCDGSCGGFCEDEGCDICNPSDCGCEDGYYCDSCNGECNGYCNVCPKCSGSSGNICEECEFGCPCSDCDGDCNGYCDECPQCNGSCGGTDPDDPDDPDPEPKTEYFISEINITGLELVGVLDLSGCKNLSTVECDNNSLAGIKLEGCKNLGYLMCDNNELTELELAPSLGVVACQNNKLTSLVIPSGSQLTTLYCSGNELTSLDVSNCGILNALDCSDNNLEKLDVSGLFMSMLICSRNPLKDNNLKLSSSIILLWCIDCKLTKLDVSGLTGLTNLMVNNNEITELVLSQKQNIGILDVSNNPLDGIDVTGLANLEYLYCNNIGATELDVTHNGELKYLECADNDLTELDLSNNTILRTLDCSNNDLSKLVPYSNQLTRLNCSNNAHLTQLPPTALFPNLWELDLDGTAITDITLPGGLYGFSCDPDQDEIDLTGMRNIPIGRIVAVGDGYVGLTSAQAESDADPEYGDTEDPGDWEPDTDTQEASWTYTLTARGGGFQGWYYDEAGTQLASEKPEFTLDDTTAGNKDYYAIFKLDPNAPHTHRYTKWTVTKPATCETAGEETGTCAAGDDTTTRPIPATGHRGVKHFAAKDATATAAGNIEYWYCSDCGSYFADQGLKTKTSYAAVTIPAWGVVQEPDPETDKPGVTPERVLFRDVTETDWFSGAVDYMVERGLMFGVEDKIFDPQGHSTRAMLMTVLARLDGADLSGGTVWYEKAVQWAVKNHISDGLRPDEDITRQEFITMLWRYAGMPDPGSHALERFPDGSQVSDYASVAMAWAVEYGIILGDGEGLSPLRPITRAEAACVMERFDRKFISVR